MLREYVKYQGNKFFFHPYHKDYLASKNGNILSIKWNKKKILKLCLNNHGYFFLVYMKIIKEEIIISIVLSMNVSKVLFQKKW